MTDSSISTLISTVCTMIVCAGVQVIGRPMVSIFDIQLALHCQARKRLCFLFLFFFLATSFSLFSCPRVLHVLSCASSVGRRLAADELGESALSQAHAHALLLCICSVHVVRTVSNSAHLTVYPLPLFSTPGSNGRLSP